MALEMNASPNLQVINEGHPRCITNIVFIHGSTGDSVSTWTHPETGLFWPKDLLAQNPAFQSCRIWNFSYPNNPELFLSYEAINSTAQSLIDALVAEFKKPGHTHYGTLDLAAHGLGGLIAQQALVIAAKNLEQFPSKLDFNLVLLGTPYFQLEKEATEPSTAQLEQVKRLEVILGGEIPDPVNAFSIWKNISEEAGRPRAMWSKIMSFRETLPTDQDGVIVRKEYSFFQEKEMVNCHPNNLWGLGDWYRVDTEPLDPEIKATHADLGRFRDITDPGYMSLLKSFAINHHYGGIMVNIAVQDAMHQDWFG